MSHRLLPLIPVQPQRTADLPALLSACVQTVAYADIFDYPLSADEIHRYLIGTAASRETVRRLLAGDELVPKYLSRQEDLFTLPGRESIVEIRREREQRAAEVWPAALRYGRLIASCPFVRMVAITGELAMDNVRPRSDIDYFIVTEPKRLWLCRAFSLVLVHLAARDGIVICPNYLLSERVLEIGQRDLYTAHEIAQMVPLAGLDTFARFRAVNRWMLDFLPNAVGAPRDARTMPHARPLRALVEAILRSPAGGVIERWERERKVRKLSRLAPADSEASFSADWCKGHFHYHGHLILEAFAARNQEFEGLPQ